MGLLSSDLSTDPNCNQPLIMDEDTVALAILGTIFVFIISSPLLITACIAAATTRKWAAERRRATCGRTGKYDTESSRLIDSAEDDSEPETEFLDSEDEEYYNVKQQRRIQDREEREADMRLTTRAKFFREWKKCWTGPGTPEKRKKDQEFKEQEQHRKIAREAVREYLRIERKRARQATHQERSENEKPVTMEHGSFFKERLIGCWSHFFGLT